MTAALQPATTAIPPERPGPTAWNRLPVSRRAAIVAVVLVAAFLLLLRATGGQWFYYDDWDLINEASGRLPFAPFLPHNGHPVFILKVLYDVLYHIVGLRHYWPYTAFALAAHVAVAELTRRILLRTGAQPVIALSAGLLVLLLGAGWMNIIWAFQLSLVGPLACGLGAVVLLDGDERGVARQVAAAILLAVGAQLSSLGAVMLAVAAIWMVLRGRLRRLWPVLPLPALVYGTWLVAERSAVTHASLTSSSLRGVPGVVWDGLSGAYGALLAYPWLGAVAGTVVLVLVAGTLAWDRRRMALPIALATGALLFLVLVALQRTANGLAEATAPRYVYVVVVLTMPLLVGGLSRIRLRGTAAAAAIAAVTAGSLVVTGYNLHVLRDQLSFWSQIKQATRSRVLATAVLVRNGETVVYPYPDPIQMPQLRYPDVGRLVAEGTLPALDDVPPGDVNSARLYLDIAVDPQPTALGGSGSPRAVSWDNAQPPAASGCVSLAGATGPEEPSVRLRLDVPAVLSLAGSGEIDVQLVPEDDSEPATEARAIMLPPSGKLWLRMALHKVDPVLSVPAGRVVVCGLAPVAPA